jgi:hypothetical protein
MNCTVEVYLLAVPTNSSKKPYIYFLHNFLMYRLTVND